MTEQEMIAQLREQLVMSMFATKEALYQEQERQRSEAADMIEALSQQLEKAREVKPLVWKHREPPAKDVDNLFGEVCRAETAWDDPYIIYDDSLCDDDGVFDDGGDSVWFIGGEFHSSVEAAQVAAQADYQRRYNAMSQEGE